MRHRGNLLILRESKAAMLASFVSFVSLLTPNTRKQMALETKNDCLIDTRLVEQILQNVLIADPDPQKQINLCDLLKANYESNGKKRRKRNFKILPDVNEISKSDAKQYCVTRLLTFEYLDHLLSSKDEISISILCGLIESAPIIFLKKIMKHNYLFHSASNVSLLCLKVIQKFLSNRSSMYKSNTENEDKIENNKFNAFLHDWILMDFFKCILMMLSLYSYPPNMEYSNHNQFIHQIMNDALSFCSTKQLETIQNYKTGYFYIENRKLYNYGIDNEQEQKQENENNLEKSLEFELAKDIDLLSLNRLYLEGNESNEQCNILVVGDGDFTFSNGLIKLWPYIASKTNLNLITSTFHDVTSLLKKYHDCNIGNTIYQIQTSLNANSKVLYDIDATDLSCFYNQYLFDRIIFNFPQTESSVGDHRLKSANQNLIFQFLQSCQPILASNGQIFIALHINQFKANTLRSSRKDDEIKKHKNAKRYVEIKPMQVYENKDMIINVSHDQFFTWNVGEILTRKELKWIKLSRSIPFYTHWYPRYNATNVKGQLFQVCKAKIHIFKRLLKK